jgi:hypothetical protein
VIARHYALTSIDSLTTFLPQLDATLVARFELSAAHEAVLTVDLATKSLLHDRVRFAITVSGVAFAVTLIPDTIVPRRIRPDAPGRLVDVRVALVKLKLDWTCTPEARAASRGPD